MKLCGVLSKSVWHGIVYNGWRAHTSTSRQKYLRLKGHMMALDSKVGEILNKQINKGFTLRICI